MNVNKCKCSSLSDLTVVDMGKEDAEVFRTLQNIRSRGNPWWWLHASKCTECGQVWLVAQEERQNDVIVMLRLEDAIAERLLNDHIWPSEFDNYEKVIKIGYDAGRSVQFIDPMDSSLKATMVDLAKERPGIRVSELARLLNLDNQTAAKIARLAADSEKLDISFDVA